MSLDKFNFVKKVDKEEGKGLSTNDYTNLDQVEVQNLRTNKTKAKQIQVEDRGSTPPNSPDVQTALENIFAYMQVLDPNEVLNIIQGLEMDISGKVDKVAGKGLSTNDFTTALLNKLNGVATNANNYTHPSTHPPSIISQNADNRFMTDAERTKLSGIQAGAQVNPGVATTSANGLMSSADKTKLNGIQYAVGTYKGDGPTISKTINIGFSPTLVIIMGSYVSSTILAVSIQTAPDIVYHTVLRGNPASTVNSPPYAENNSASFLDQSSSAPRTDGFLATLNTNLENHNYRYFAIKLE